MKEPKVGTVAETLLDAARRGDPGAAEELADLIRGYARHVCRGRSPGPDAGLTWEDVAQEASRRLFQVGLKQARPGGPVRSYLYAIVRSVYLQMIRGASRRVRREQEGEAWIRSAPSPERRTLLHRILIRLSDDCRHLLARLYFDGAGYDELAAELHMAESSVRAKASRCLGRAREIARA